MTRFLSSITDFFKSVRLTVVVLLLLAGTSILGTVIPQNKHAADYIKAFGEPLYRFFHILDLTDMYSSWWFVLLIILLTLNMLVCTISRFQTTRKLAFGSGFKGFSSLPVQTEATLDTPPEELEAPIKQTISSSFSSMRELSPPGGFALEAEKGRLTRLGADVVHVGILILLAGALVGRIFGYDGFVNVPEGETVNTITLRNTTEKRPLDFSIRCNDFSLSHYESGSVKEYRSSLTILEDGKEVLDKEIIVNDPLTYKGITFYQASYGSMGAKDFTIRFTERATGKTVTKPIAQGESVPFGNGKAFTFDRYDSDYAFKGRSVGEAVIGTLTEEGKAPQEVVLLTRFSNYDKMRKGEWVLAIDGHEHAYYTGLQVTYDPGVALVYIGFILMIAGCTVAFFMSHKKVRIEVTPCSKGSRVTISGSSRKSKWWIKRYAEQVISSLEKQR